MYKLCLNSRDELLIIDLEKIAYFQANGNYTHLNYIGTWPKDRPSPFVRLGRSLIVNQTYISEISVIRQKLTLSDREGHAHSLTVPKPLLKQYKERINELYLKRQSNN